MIQITDRITLHDDELHFTFIRSSGPGGQNVNKVSTAAQLRFDVAHSPSLDDEIRKRLRELAGSRMTNDGELIITARRFRSQESNRLDAINRLTELLMKAEKKPVRRIRTTPSTSSKLNRLLEKDAIKEKKKLRKPISSRNIETL